MLVFSKENLVSEKRLIFLDPEDRLVVFDLMFSNSKAIRLVTIYASASSDGKSDYSEIYGYFTLFIFDRSL